jgi:hypothetical protein
VKRIVYYAFVPFILPLAFFAILGLMALDIIDERRAKRRGL